ncbi:hypothetical protein IMG5_150060 [Ichthyophthirius multifiliis]|uniref:Exonuclease 1 n=1 Tax=Ichthyophthirius multifiliis TaxID=5932 RepID=G0QYJ0_ICHMU|nr:hypothetical protein IMG5_150060 [Ichthyophthirius multifiliis]EGR29715.1 hypothetical protein IMG5_150060 [Ichthyophthirius multifiliis]|eukprot:XP_004030951.1 hypothetical protein IMG5_150060 [Ichthyophthirius multifiliis]
MDKPTKKHIEFCIKRIEDILSFGIKKIVLVFDGHKLPSKEQTEQIRKTNREEARQEALKLMEEGKKEQAFKKFASSVDVTAQMAYDLIKVFEGRQDVECIVSPFEADAQLAYLSKTNYVDLVVSEDSDLLAFGYSKFE